VETGVQVKRRSEVVAIPLLSLAYIFPLCINTNSKENSRSFSIDYHATLKSQRSALITVIDLNDSQLVPCLVTGFECYRSPLVQSRTS